MPIKNYTTSISSDKTIGEIESLLARNGAKSIMKEYDKDGSVCQLCFVLKVRQNELPFALPLREDSILKLLENQRQARKIPAAYVNKEQAKRIGWRILRDWVDAQLALVEIGMVQIEEVFMPYLWNPVSKKTLYEMSISGGFQNLLLSST